MTVEGVGVTLKVHWRRKGEGQEAGLSTKLSVNKHRKGSEDREDR
jgi:hypothetical protein